MSKSYSLCSVGLYKKKSLCGSLFTTYPHEDNMWLLSSFQLLHRNKGGKSWSSMVLFLLFQFDYIFFFLSFLHFLLDPISFFVFFLSFFHSLNRQRPLKSKRTQARNGDGSKEHPILNHTWPTHPFQGTHY